MTTRFGAIKLPINRLHIELTNICNFSCEFCPDSIMKRTRGMMPAVTARAIIDEASNTGIFNFVMFHVMGEPTLHPELTDLAEYARSKNVDVCITTNGSRMDIDIFRALQEAGVRQIIISLQTPDKETFFMRGAGGLAFDDYADGISAIAKASINDAYATKLTISFLSSPLRRLIIPVAKEFSIADTSAKLRGYLKLWAERILKGSRLESRLHDVLKQIEKSKSYRENRITVTNKLSFQTRILGDWSKPPGKKIVRARFGYCHGIQENLGILYNGDYVFCCTDYDGRTSTANFNDMSITDYLLSDDVQKTVRGFRRFRVVDPYCQVCIGDRSYLNTFVKQIGSILYFKIFKRYQKP